MAYSGASPADPVPSYEQLVEHVSAGCKPSEDWRIGTEHEKFGFRLSDKKPLSYGGNAGVHALLDRLCERFG